MNILLYIPDINRNQGGLYQYAIALINTLTEAGQHNYYIFRLAKLEEIESLDAKSKWIYLLKIDECRESLLVSNVNWLKKGINEVFHRIGLNIKLKLKTSLNKVIRKYHIDILHCPNDWLPQNVSIPMIATMHDLQELYFPENFSAGERVNRAMYKKETIHHASLIVCSYQHVREDLLRFFELDQKNVKVCLLKMDNLWFNKLNEEIHPIPEGIGSNYILYPAATWAHKNHINLILAFKHAIASFPELHLVCTGHQTDYYFEEIEPLIRELDLGNRIHFMGVVGDEQLYSLYQRCGGVIVPTKYEAGSFPLMESILMEVPVICSNVTSLPETMGYQKDFLFDPDDIDDMAEKMAKLINDDFYILKNKEVTKSLQTRLIETGAEEVLLNIYSELETRAT